MAKDCGNQVTITPLAAMTISLASLPQLNMGFINGVYGDYFFNFLCARQVTGIHIDNPIFLFCFAFFFFLIMTLMVSDRKYYRKKIVYLLPEQWWEASGV